MDNVNAGYVNGDALVEPAQLAEMFGEPGLVILDATWFLPPTDRDALAEYRAAHIPGALYFDIDDIVDPESSLPHTMPSAEIFARKVGELGISNESKIIVYDALGAFSAPRVWWMFRLMGHNSIAVLNGGLPRWRAESHPVTDEITKIVAADFSAHFNQAQMKSMTELANQIDDGTIQVLDARSQDRFFGREPERRPGVRSGHMPGAKNLPYAALLNSNDQTFKAAADLRDAFESASITQEKTVVTTCGSGVTACILSLGLHLIGRSDWAVYDGSWTEWGGSSETPVEV